MKGHDHKYVNTLWTGVSPSWRVITLLTLDMGWKMRLSVQEGKKYAQGLLNIHKSKSKKISQCYTCNRRYPKGHFFKHRL
ncbi:MAG: hypothetical protein AYK19_14020 [Theionarchaea archaeon DG-70-1]|nr:MAG: hypothetical protein AYK19_14020 [Theionarchaea archaeon DG-70-1]